MPDTNWTFTGSLSVYFMTDLQCADGKHSLANTTPVNTVLMTDHGNVLNLQQIGPEVQQPFG